MTTKMPTTTRRAPRTMGDIREDDGNEVNGSNGGVITTKEANAWQHWQLQHLDNLDNHNRMTLAKTTQQWQQQSDHCNDAMTPMIVMRRQQRQCNNGNDNFMTLMITTT
jgi:hypothetical protein